MSRIVTIELDDARAAELERIARECGARVEDVVRDAIDVLALARAPKGPPPLTDEERAEIDHAIAQADAGRVAGQGEIEARDARRFGK
ncbi:MAG: hypothetical protein MI723_12975 [Caulobacterales bacterium]|nr:hypothetical protein [Caulobacterales bacterium]